MKKNRIILMLAALLLPLAAGAQSDSCTITLPWSENFDSYTTDGGTASPDCWNRFNPFVMNATTTRPNFWVFSYGTHGTVLNFNGSGNNGTPSGIMRIATPLIPASLNNLSLEFEVSGDGLMIYGATDTADLTTYVLIGTFSGPSMTQWSSYELHTDSIDGMPSEQGYLVFASAYGYGSGNYATARLDNLQVGELTICERPASVTVSMVGPGGATVSWPAVEGALMYSVSYSTTDDIETAEVEWTGETSIALANLEPGTQYYVWVQTDCGNATSGARTATFTTQDACYSLLNLAQTGSTFDAASFSWEYSAMGNASTTVLAVLHDVTDNTIEDVETYLTTGATSHIFTNLDNSHEYEVTLYTICGDDTAAGVSSFIYFRSCGESPLSNGGYDKSSSCPIAPGYDASTSMMLYDADILFSMDTIRGIALHRPETGSAVTRTLNIYMGHTVLDSLTSNPGINGMQQVATNTQYTLAVQEWDTLLFDTFFVYNGSSNVLVAIHDVTGTHSTGSPAEWYWHNAETKTYYSTTYNGAASSFTSYSRPDIRFVGDCNNDMMCNPPVASMGEVDSMTAVVNWYGPSASQYIVEYRMQGENVWIVVDTIYGDSYALTDLQPASNYEVRIGIICDTMVRYCSAITFETDCALIHLPFHFTQGNMSTVAEHGNAFSPCWSFSEYIYKGKLTFSHRGYVRNADLNQWIMLPAIAEPLSGARLRTWVGSSDHGYFAVGVASDNDYSTTVWLDTVEVPAGSPDNDHNEYISYLDQYTGTGNRVVIAPIVNNIYHYMYFFDFHLEEIEECMPVDDLTLDAAGANTLTVHWTPRGNATEWVVYVDGDSVALVQDDPSCTINGLQPFTAYNVSVRSRCDEDMLSNPMAETFRTGCEGDECQVTLVGHSSAGDGWHGSHLHVKSNGEDIEDFTLLQGSEKSVDVHVCQNATISLNWTSLNDAEVCSFALVGVSGDTLYSFADGSQLEDGELFVTDSICTYDPNAAPTCANRYEALVEEVCDNYVWRGQTLTAGGSYSDTVAGAVEGGCDSIFSLTLTVNYSVTQTIDTTAEDSFVWNGTIYNMSGNYTFDGETSAGCDSTVTLNLIITHTGCENIYDTAAADGCDGYLWRGNTYTASGMYTSIVAGVAEGGCDSIYVLDLTVNHSVTSEEEASDCDSYVWHGQTYTATGSYNDIVVGATAEGCDSIYTLALTIHYSVDSTIVVSTHESYSWHGNTYTQSGTYTWTGETTAGCDSTVTLVLTITQGIDDVESQLMALYPNPTNGIVKIVSEGMQKIEVYDAIGRMVKVVTDNDIVDLSNMPQGNYTLRITMAEGTVVRRVIKL